MGYRPNFPPTNTNIATLPVSGAVSDTFQSLNLDGSGAAVRTARTQDFTYVQGRYTELSATTADVLISANTVLTAAAHNRRRLIASAALTISAGAFNTIGATFQCDVLNDSGGVVTIGSGITSLISTVAAGQSARIVGYMNGGTSVIRAFISPSLTGTGVTAGSGNPPTATNLLSDTAVSYTLTQLAATLAPILAPLLAPATATGATINGAPSTGIVGTAITGVTGTLSPSGATGYASLTIAGTEQTPRVSFSGTSVPNLTPNSAGATTIGIYAAASGGSALVTSGTITVSAGTTATAATIAGAPSTGTVGTAITGLTDTLTPSGATAYASLTIAGTEQTPRTSFTGTSIPSLTPATAGAATIAIYAAASGGSALATSGTITVSAATATAATIAGAPSTATVGTAITGLTDTLTPSSVTAYASLTIAGTEQTPRTAFTGTSVPSLTPATAGAATVSIYAASSGGSALATSGTITVSAAAGGASTRYTLSAGSSPFVTSASFGGGNVTGNGTNQITITGPGGIAPTSFNACWTRSNTVVPTPGSGPNQYGSNTQEYGTATVRSGYPNLWDLNTYVWAKGSPTTGAYYLWTNWTDSSGSGWTVYPATLTMSA